MVTKQFTDINTVGLWICFGSQMLAQAAYQCHYESCLIFPFFGGGWGRVESQHERQSLQARTPLSNVLRGRTFKRQDAYLEARHA